MKMTNAIQLPDFSMMTAVEARDWFNTHRKEFTIKYNDRFGTNGADQMVRWLDRLLKLTDALEGAMQHLGPAYRGM
jgi:hypothetical protein